MIGDADIFYQWPLQHASWIMWPHDTIRGRQQILRNNSWFGWASGFKLSAMHLYCWYESTDIQQDLFKAGRDLNLRSNFEVVLPRSNYASFDASRRKKDTDVSYFTILENDFGPYRTCRHIALVVGPWMLYDWSGVKSDLTIQVKQNIGYRLFFPSRRFSWLSSQASACGTTQNIKIT